MAARRAGDNDNNGNDGLMALAGAADGAVVGGRNDGYVDSQTAWWWQNSEERSAQV